MVDGRLEQHFRRRVGVVIRVGEGEFEGFVGVGGLGGALQGRVPVCHVAAGGEGGDSRGGLGHEGHEFGL